VTTIRSAARIAAARAVARRTEKLLRGCGALRDGHFKRDDGRHAPRMLDIGPAHADPPVVAELAEMIAAGALGADGRPMVDAVVGTADTGPLADAVARWLGVRAVGGPSVGRGASGGHVALDLALGERALVLEGAAVAREGLGRLVSAVEARGGEIVECAAVVDLSGAPASIESPRTGRVYPVRALWRPEPGIVEAGAATCPGCAKGLPLV
jgi:orotate phosphoribosyltransferase